jgi:putative ABC transport system permease protein
MGIPLLRGESFTGVETREGAQVVIVNEAFAKKFWEGEDPLGKRLRTGDERPWVSVIGVVGNVRHVGLSEPIRPTYYFPVALLPWRTMTLVVRTTGDPEAISASLRQAIARIDPTLPIYDVRLYEQFVADSVAAPRFNSMLLLVFAVVAVTLAAVGIYGVLAYTVGQRTHEIGIRMALGARASDVPWLVLRQGLAMVGVGLAIGFVAAFLLARVLESLLFGVGARDPVTFVAVALLLTAVACAACFAPAWRAARVDPMVALRYE